MAKLLKDHTSYNDKGPNSEEDFEKLRKLCHMHASLEECASFFDCSGDSIERRIKEKYNMTFAEYFSQESGKGKVSLRRKQWGVAMRDHPGMLIHLGKVYLNQRESKDINLNQDKPFELSYSLDDDE